MPETRKAVRVLTVKIEHNWKNADDKARFSRLRDLQWCSAHYRNNVSLYHLVQSRGFRVDPDKGDKNDISKWARKNFKGDLSGDAYSCAEQEVRQAWSKDAKRILAGQPPPMWKPTAALSITGKEKRQDSGVRLEKDGDSYVLAIRAQSQDCEGGGWFHLPIARHTLRDEYCGPNLEGMLTWRIPIKKV